MSQLIIGTKTLLSRVYREVSVSGGIRKIDLSKRLVALKKDKSIIDTVFSWGKGLIGLISGAIKAITKIAISATKIFGWLINLGQIVYNFNWNSSDQELSKLIDSRNKQLLTVWGGALGGVLGWTTAIAVGYGIGLVLPVIGSAAVANAIALNAGKEALDEGLARITQAMSATIRTITGNAVIGGYASLRRFVKGLPLKALQTVFGKDFANWIKNKWGNQGEPIISISQFVENKVQSIGGDGLKNFVDAFLQEGYESFIEGGFIVAAEIDSQYAQAKLATKSQLGAERLVEVVPDERIPDEKITLYGKEELLKPQVINTVTNYRMLNNKDVGQVVGMPVQEFTKAKLSQRTLIIHWFNVPKPPWRVRAGGKLKEATYTVPDVKLGSLQWEKIKKAAGGNDGFLWGRHRCTVNLDNGRQMACYGSTEGDAKDLVEDLLSLSNAEILTMSVSEEKKVGKKNKLPDGVKETTRMYPAYFVLVYRHEVSQDGKLSTNAKRYKETRQRFELWTDSRPIDYEERMRELLSGQ